MSTTFGTSEGDTTTASRRKSSTTASGLRLGLAQPSGELVARQHFQKFGQQHLARAELELPDLGTIDEPSRQPCPDQARDEQIGIEDKAHGARATQAPCPARRSWRAD